MGTRNTVPSVSQRKGLVDVGTGILLFLLQETKCSKLRIQVSSVVGVDRGGIRSGPSDWPKDEDRPNPSVRRNASRSSDDLESRDPVGWTWQGERERKKKIEKEGKTKPFPCSFVLRVKIVLRKGRLPDPISVLRRRIGLGT